MNAPPPWRWCRLPGCPFRGPFTSPAGRGSHRRRIHGIASVAQRRRRPEGGTIPCEFPGCTVAGFLTIGGRATHYRIGHGVKTGNAESIRRRERRAVARKLLEPPPENGPIAIRIPESIGSERVDVSGRTRIEDADRIRIAFVLRNAVARWAFELRAANLDVADALAEILASHFARGSRLRASEPKPISLPQREHLRRRLQYAICVTWARSLDLAPATLANAIALALPELPRTGGA